MTDRAQVLAYDREKNIYKDAYVENFRKVRYFPTLASIGMGKSEGESIVLVEEDGGSGACTSPQKDHNNSHVPSAAVQSQSSSTTSAVRFHHIEREPLNPNSLERLFDNHPPLSCFRNQVLCKHLNARKDRKCNTERELPSAFTTSATASSPFALTSRYGSGQPSPPIFKRPSISEAKAAIHRKITYDPQEQSPRVMPIRDRQQWRQELNNTTKQWKHCNSVDAKEDIRVKSYFNLPPEQLVVADRKYVRDFIKRNVEAYQASRQQRPCSNANQQQ